MKKKNKIRICLVEDEKVILRSLSKLIQIQPDFELKGSFLSAEEALAEAVWQETDVLFIDLGLPGMSGVELIAKSLEINPQLQPLVFTGCDYGETVLAALNAGACGYLLKGIPTTEVIESIRQLVNGGAPMNPSVTRHLITRFQMMEKLPECDPLTTREKDILKQIANGLTYDEIGDELCISRHTVHTHVKKLYGKLHAESRTDALKKAAALGYLNNL